MLARSGAKERIWDRIFVDPALSRAAAVLALTELEAEELSSRSPAPIAVHQISNGVAIRSERNSSSTVHPIIVFVGRLQERKRPVLFVRMARKLLESYPSARFEIIGPDEGEGDAIEAAIHEYGVQHAVQVVGALNRSDVVEKVARSSVFVLPSYGEVKSMAVIEALASGVPVVVCRENGLAGDVERYTAGLVAKDTPEDLARACAQILRDEPVGFGSRAKELAVAEYSIEAVVGQLEHFYRGADELRKEA